LHNDYNKTPKKKQEGKLSSASSKKLRTLKLSKSFDSNKLMARAERVRLCGTMLHIKRCENGHEFLHRANFCRDRLCPMCAERRSQKYFAEINELLHVAAQRFKMRYIFLTLTVRNMPGSELSDTLTQMFKGFNDMVRLKDVDKNLIGWIRNLEVTVDKESYHPHFHCILAVRPSYFKDGYISQKRWTELWQGCAKLDYTPIVHVQSVKPKKRESGIESAIAETSKYTVKDTDYIKTSEKETDSIVGILAYALHSRRLIGFGKEFRKIRAEFKHNQSNLNEPGVCDENCPICNSTLKDLFYKWQFNVAQYVQVK